MSLRIVVDTSVFISALIGSKGPSRELIRRSLQREYQPLMGDALFTEYELVMISSQKSLATKTGRLLNNGLL